MTSRRYQIAASGSHVFAAAGSFTDTIVAAIDATHKVRVFRVDLVIDQATAAATRIRGSVRNNVAIIGMGEVTGAQPSDHIDFGEEGYLCSANVSLNVVWNASAACTVYYVANYVVEG